MVAYFEELKAEHFAEGQQVEQLDYFAVQEEPHDSVQAGEN